MGRARAPPPRRRRPRAAHPPCGCVQALVAAPLLQFAKQPAKSHQRMSPVERVQKLLQEGRRALAFTEAADLAYRKRRLPDQVVDEALAAVQQEPYDPRYNLVGEVNAATEFLLIYDQTPDVVLDRLYTHLRGYGRAMCGIIEHPCASLATRRRVFLDGKHIPTYRQYLSSREDARRDPEIRAVLLRSKDPVVVRQLTEDRPGLPDSDERYIRKWFRT